jgi:dTDP-4-dehydrorhamnose reductase
MIDFVIFGKNGQLGSELEKLCTKNKKDFLAFSREELDITDHKKTCEVLAKIKPKTVINTAAFHVVEDCETNPLKAFALNFLAVKNLAETARKINANFFTYSTDYVFDGNKKKPYNEDDIPNPLQIYGLSKLSGEYITRAIYPEKTYIIRSCGIFGGSGSRSKKGNFVLNILKEAHKDGVLEVNNNQIVSPTYAGDLANATLKLLELNSQAGVYHLVNEGCLSWYEFAKKIINLSGLRKRILPRKINIKDISIVRPKFSALANIKAKNKGIVLPSINDGLKEYLDQIL